MLDIWVGFVSSMFWFSVTMPKLFQDNTMARSVADLASIPAEETLVKPQPEMEQGLLT